MLADLQEALVALATDARVRARFQGGDVVRALEGWSLDQTERAMLAALPYEALRRCAEALLGKRWEDLRRVVPLTARVAPRLERHYRDWLAEHPALAADTVLDPGPAEGLRALTALVERLDADDLAPGYAAPLLVHEVLEACSRADGQPRFARAAHPVHEIAADLRRGIVPLDRGPAPAAPHFEYRFTRNGVQHRRVER